MLTLVYLSFVVLGLPVGAIGVAWPSIRDHFGLAQEALGTLFLFNTLGYLSASFLTGQFIKKLGMGRAIAVSCMISASGFAAFSASPAWGLLVITGFIGGVGTGFVDSGINTFVAKSYSPRIMNGLHACFGVGATLAPLLMTAILTAEISWRWGYVIVAILWALLVAGFLLTMRYSIFETSSTNGIQDESDSQAPYAQTLRMPLMWMSVAIFVMYVGVEVGTGSWAFTLFTEGRGVGEEAAGLLVSIYWGSLTVGRALFGIVPITDRWGVVGLVRICILGVVVGGLFLWWNPASAISYLGLALLGFAQAPIFPLLISHTPVRLGKRHAPNAIGFQVAGAGFGVAIIPGLIGIMMGGSNYEVIAAFLFFNAVAMLLAHEATLYIETTQRSR